MKYNEVSDTVGFAGVNQGLHLVVSSVHALGARKQKLHFLWAKEHLKENTSDQLIEYTSPSHNY